MIKNICTSLTVQKERIKYLNKLLDGWFIPNKLIIKFIGLRNSITLKQNRAFVFKLDN